MSGGDIIGIGFLSLLGVAILWALFVQLVREPREDRLAKEMSELARHRIENTEAGLLLRRINTYSLDSESSRKVSQGEALLRALPTTRWRQFEMLAAELLSIQGWNVEVTQATGDSGIDFIGTNSSGVVAVGQAKHQKGSVSQPVVQAALGAAIGEGASLLVVATSNGFTRQALDWVSRLPSGGVKIQLWERKDIVGMIDGLEPDEVGKFVSRFLTGSSKRKHGNLLSIGSELTAIEAEVQLEVEVRYGRTPNCWEHHKPMRLHLDGDHETQIWWRCTARYCVRIRNEEGEHAFLRRDNGWETQRKNYRRR